MRTQEWGPREWQEKEIAVWNRWVSQMTFQRPLLIKLERRVLFEGSTNRWWNGWHLLAIGNARVDRFQRQRERLKFNLYGIRWKRYQDRVNSIAIHDSVQTRRSADRGVKIIQPPPANSGTVYIIFFSCLSTQEEMPRWSFRWLLPSTQCLWLFESIILRDQHQS